MASVKVDGFHGMVPVVEPRLLPTANAQLAINAWLAGGALNGFGLPVQVKALASTTKRVYRIPNDQKSTDVNAASTWMEFDDVYTDVIRSPVINDEYHRYYWCSPSTGPRYNTLARIQANQPPYLVGIPPSVTAVNIAITPVDISPNKPVSVTRSYVFTYVSLFGEEGPPSPPATATAATSDYWDITIPPITTDISDNRPFYDPSFPPEKQYGKVNVYRTVTGTDGVATFYWAYQFNAVGRPFTFRDWQTDDMISINAQLISTDWSGPDPGMQGIIQMPNGMVAGFKDNTVFFCEPYRPHAWPAKYDTNVNYPVVGLGVVNQTLVACTTNTPAVLTGIHPSSITATKIDTAEACVNRGSIVSTTGGVFYASSRGLILVSTGGVKNLSSNYISERQWWQLYPPASFKAVFHNGAYTAFGMGNNQTSGFSFDGTTSPPIIGNLGSPAAVVGVSRDEWTGFAFLIMGSAAWLWNPLDATQVVPYIWRSKVFQLQFDDNIGAARIFFTPLPLPRGQLNAWHTQGGLTIDKYAQISFFCDGQLRVTRDITQNGQTFRLPAGYKGQNWQFEIMGRVLISNVQIASSPRELRQV